MSRKHFIAIAADFKNLLGGAKTPAERDILKVAAGLLADTFAGCNSRFDRNRFLRACGL